MISEQIKHLSFCKVRKLSKKPFETKWEKTPYTYDQITKWVADGNNYGIMSGYYDLVTLDCDCEEYVKLAEAHLPKTFTVQSSSPKKRHFLFYMTDFPRHKDKIIFIDPNNPDDQKKEGGDIRFKGFQSLGPGSIHPDTKKPYIVHDDLPIADLSFSVIHDLFGKYFKTQIIPSTVMENNDNSPVPVPIIDVMEYYKINLTARQCGCEHYGAHPIHGSKGGTNFSINVKDNVWHCFRCGTGGTSVHLVALMERILDCSEIVPKCLNKEKLKQVAYVINDKFGINILPDKKHKQHATLFNTINIFKSDQNLASALQYNEFSGLIEINKKTSWDISSLSKYPRNINDSDGVLIKGYLATEKNIEPNINIIDEACYITSQSNSYHPIREYLESLHWDGVDRVSDWLIKYCGAEDNKLNRYVSRMFLVAAVKRVFEPGCQYDHMIILEGEQGVNKTRLLEAIGGQWYNNITLIDRDKDTVQRMQGSWIIEVGELAVLKKRDSESIKNFITLKFDDARFAYGRKNSRYPRQSIFIGTVNATDAGYLNDHTGNRRFVPVEIKYADIDQIRKDRDQLFAQAVEIYKEGFDVYISNDLEKDLIVAQEDREVYDEWCDIIRQGLWNQRMDMIDLVTPIGLYTKFINDDVSRYDGFSRGRMVNVLSKIGAVKVGHKTVNGISGKYYDISKVREQLAKDYAEEEPKWVREQQ
jgi:hypothetical protein